VLEKVAGIELSPEKTHFYLCGNPKMVESVTGFLYKKDYTRHSKKKPGAIHVEEY
jgi:ferredoxin/flavodoxin---NADP+ reductase